MKTSLVVSRLFARQRRWLAALALCGLLSLAFVAARLVIAIPIPLEDVIPPERLVSWDPGVRGGIPATYYRVNVMDFGAAGDGVTDDGPAFNAAIQAAPAPGFVWVPPGDYRISTIVQLKSGIVLQGAGPAQTRLLIDIPNSGQRGGVEMRGSMENVDIAVTAGYSLGSTQLELADTSGITPGTMLWLYQDDDVDAMYTVDYWITDYSIYSMSQMIGAAAVEGNTITLDVPLRLDYQASLNPRVRIVHPIENAGIESLYLERIDTADAFTISMEKAQNCWVRYVESNNTFRAHVWAFYSRFLTIRDNYFHHAHDYGGGGHGYGVTFADSTSDSLVTNNIFHTLRHAMMVKEGANGNVFSYNYSYETMGGKADISLHGHYNYANLFEGNKVENLVVADWWGPSGPYTTAFRNVITTNGGISVRDHSDRPNVVGNVTPRIDIRSGPDIIIFGYPVYMGGVVTDLTDGNLVDGVLEWSGAPDPLVLPASHYLDGPPDFWGNRPWPNMGADLATPVGRLPAQERKYQIDNGLWQPPLPLIATETGNPGQAQVINARPGETLFVFAGTGGTGNGPCLPIFGNLCLDLLPPLQYLGAVAANANGTALITVPNPPAYIQALVYRGAGGSLSIKSNPAAVD